MPLKFEISVDDKGNAAIDRLHKNVGDLKKKTDGLGTTFKNVFGALAAAEGLRRIAKFSIDAVKTFMEQERAEKRLGAAMKERGVFTEQAIQHAKNFANTMQTTLNVEDDEILRIQTLLTQYGFYGKALDDATEAAVNLAKAKDMDLFAAADKIGLDIATENGALHKLGIMATGAAGSAERLHSVLMDIGEKFGGSAAADAETYAGKLKSIEIQFGELKESIGMNLIPAFVSLAGVADSAINVMNKFFGFNPTPIDQTAERVRALKGDVADFEKQITSGGLQAVNPLTGKLGPVSDEAAAKIRGLQAAIRSTLDDIKKLEGSSAGGVKKSSMMEPLGPYNINDDPTYNKEAGQLAKDIAAGEAVRMKNWEEMQKKKQDLYFAEMDLMNELADQDAKNDEEAAERKKRLAELQVANMQGFVSTSRQLAEMFMDDSVAMFGMAKGFAMAEATINAYQSITKTLALGGAFAIPSAIATGAMAFAQVAQISGTQPQGFATGTNFAPGGFADVGEHGRERVYLPRGSKVLPHEETERAMAQSGGPSITVNVYGNGDQRWVRDTLLPIIHKEGGRR